MLATLTRFDIEIDAQSTRDALSDLEDKWTSERVYIVGTDVDYAVYLEFGRGPVTPDSADALQFEDEDGNTIYRARAEGHRPYPFVRPAVREFKANPEDFVTDNTGFQDFAQIPNGDTLVKAVANALATQMEKNASADSATDRSPGTHPEHPVRDTGTLVASLGAQRVE